MASINALKRLATEKRDEASKLWKSFQDSDKPMPDAEATRFDTLIGEAETAAREAADMEAREKRLNDLDAAHRAAGGDSAGSRSGFADGSEVHEDIQEYSILRALRSFGDHRSGQGRFDGIEAEVHAELNKRRLEAGLCAARGVLIPSNLGVSTAGALRAARMGMYRHALGNGPRTQADFRHGNGVEARALDTTAGAGSIPTILDSDMISILRSRMVTAALGARVLTDMQGLFSIPKQTGTATGSWLAEGAAPASQSSQTIGQVPFSPKTVSAYTDYTRRFLSQTSIDAEQFVRADLAAILARAVESAALNGPGTGNTPLGVGQIAGTNIVEIGANGGPLTWDAIVDMETQVAIDNADVGALAYVVNAVTRGHAKRTPIVAGYPSFLWDRQSPGTPLNGYGSGVTNLLPSNLVKGTSGAVCSMALFGNWNDLIYVFWGSLDVLVDPYSNATSGGVRVVAMQDGDLNVRHAESFCKVIDIKAAA